MEPVEPASLKRVKASAPGDRRQLGELFNKLNELKVSKSTTNVFFNLATYNPTHRLAINLRVVLGQMALREIRNVPKDLLSEREYKALVELHLVGVPEKQLEVAHWLLNLYDRWIMLKSLSKSFRTAAAESESSIKPPLLHDLLGDGHVVTTG
jgi:hypothetical protein